MFNEPHTNFMIPSAEMPKHGYISVAAESFLLNPESFSLNFECALLDAQFAPVAAESFLLGGESF